MTSRLTSLLCGIAIGLSGIAFMLTMSALSRSGGAYAERAVPGHDPLPELSCFRSTQHVVNGVCTYEPADLHGRIIATGN